MQRVNLRRNRHRALPSREPMTPPPPPPLPPTPPSNPRVAKLPLRSLSSSPDTLPKGAPGRRRQLFLCSSDLPILAATTLVGFCLLVPPRFKTISSFIPRSQNPQRDSLLRPRDRAQRCFVFWHQKKEGGRKERG